VLPRYETWSLLAAARFLLAFIVTTQHLSMYANLGLLSVVRKLGAFEAVLGFLIISGYSIGYSYRAAPVGFLQRRVRRIYPTYLVAICLTALAYKTPPTFANATVLLENALFLNQITTHESYVMPAWSLSLEVWLYCLTPWLFSRSTSTGRRLMFASLAAFIGYEICRAGFHMSYYANVSFGLNLVFLSFAWIGGFQLGRVAIFERRRLLDIGLLLIGYVFVEVAVRVIGRVRHGEESLILPFDVSELAFRAATVAGVWLLFLYISKVKAGAVKSTFLRFLGDISYPLYLIHTAIAVLVVHLLGEGASVYVLFAFVLAGSTLLYWLVDRYSWKRHLTAAPGRGVPSEGSDAR
jgi:peptidoglycan/LPS O-acetylase OafA/YrhL